MPKLVGGTQLDMSWISGVTDLEGAFAIGCLHYPGVYALILQDTVEVLKEPVSGLIADGVRTDGDDL